MKHIPSSLQESKVLHLQADMQAIQAMLNTTQQYAPQSVLSRELKSASFHLISAYPRVAAGTETHAEWKSRCETYQQVKALYTAWWNVYEMCIWIETNGPKHKNHYTSAQSRSMAVLYAKDEGIQYP